MITHSPDDFRARTYDVFISYKREDDAAREVLVAAPSPSLSSPARRTGGAALRPARRT